MSDASLLPNGYTALEPFLPQWALKTSSERATRRTASTSEDREAFFTATAPLMEAAMDYLDGKQLAALTPEDQRLMDLMLSLAHVALAVEIQGPDEIKSAPWRDRMRITHSASNRAPAR